jgi:hypothetical protein
MIGTGTPKSRVYRCKMQKKYFTRYKQNREHIRKSAWQQKNMNGS